MTCHPFILKENELRQKNIQDILDKIHMRDDYLEQIASKLGYKTDFNETFWKFPQTLRHCTPPENVPDILKDGLLAQHLSRSLSNRSIRSAVFTTMESEEIGWNQQYYGNGVIEIDISSMKAEGVMPYVSMEPDWERALLLAAVYTRLTEKEHYDEEFVSSSDGTSRYTVIVHEHIPAKYLKEI